MISESGLTGRGQHPLVRGELTRRLVRQRAVWAGEGARTY